MGLLGCFEWHLLFKKVLSSLGTCLQDIFAVLELWLWKMYWQTNLMKTLMKIIVSHIFPGREREVFQRGYKNIIWSVNLIPVFFFLVLGIIFGFRFDTHCVHRQYFLFLDLYSSSMLCLYYKWKMLYRGFTVSFFLWLSSPLPWVAEDSLMLRYAVLVKVMFWGVPHSWLQLCFSWLLSCCILVSSKNVTCIIINKNIFFL